jgi:predicted nucleic acid-binding protein
MKPFWCIIDANIILEAIRYKSLPLKKRHYPEAFKVLEYFSNGAFIWVYSEAILREYRIQFHLLKQNVTKSKDKRSFDTGLFNALLKTIRFGPGLVEPTESQNQDANEVIMNPKRAEHLRDPDDYPYLSAADAAKIQGVDIFVLVASEDSDLYTLNKYKGIPIITLEQLLKSLDSAETKAFDVFPELSAFMNEINPFHKK